MNNKLEDQIHSILAWASRCELLKKPLTKDRAERVLNEATKLLERTVIMNFVEKSKALPGEETSKIVKDIVPKMEEDIGYILFHLIILSELIGSNLFTCLTRVREENFWRTVYSKVANTQDD